MSSRVIAATTSAGSAPDQGHTTVGTGLARLPNHCHNFDQLSSIVSTPARGPVIHGAPNGRGAATCAAPSADLRCIAAQRLGLALGWWCDRGRTSMEYEGSARCRGRGPCGPVPVRRRTPACSVREWLGINPRTGEKHLPDARESTAAKARASPSTRSTTCLSTRTCFVVFGSAARSAAPTGSPTFAGH